MKTEKKSQARGLRLQGWSINKIAKELNVSKSSVSIWVRDIVLDPKYQKALKDNGDFCRKVLLDSIVQKRRDDRKKWRAEGFELAAKDDVFRIVCSLYWGEGTKKNTFAISNADVDLLRVICSWFKKNDLFDRVVF